MPYAFWLLPAGRSAHSAQLWGRGDAAGGQVGTKRGLDIRAYYTQLLKKGARKSRAMALMIVSRQPAVASRFTVGLAENMSNTDSDETGAQFVAVVQKVLSYQVSSVSLSNIIVWTRLHARP